MYFGSRNFTTYYREREDGSGRLAVDRPRDCNDQATETGEGESFSRRIEWLEVSEMEEAASELRPAVRL